MNFPRVAMAALAAWIVYLGVSYLVHGLLLTNVYRQHTAMRPAGDQMAILPIAFAFSLLGFFAFSYAYAKGYEGSGGTQEGLRFGVLVGILICTFSVVFEYMVWPVSGTLLVAWIVDYIVEFAIYGVIVGIVYKPHRPAARRTAGV
jgi:hypothetical protein